jgi:hypothetical protein
LFTLHQNYLHDRKTGKSLQYFYKTDSDFKNHFGHIKFDTSEPVDGYGAQNNYGHCPIRVRTSDLSITGQRAYQLL